MGGARLGLRGHDLLVYARVRPRPAPGSPGAGRLLRLAPSQMTALRQFVSLVDQLKVPPADGLADQVPAARLDRGVKRWL
ncbi:DUF6417 family protein [Streptomyces sp. SA15]|uniref:DUF6417 family protein n=1 Tax=Streptomyces sp. SA15 TaxID=934019 RepID=UPI00211BB3CE|nr:DUF6417 family protein [Streptomyces sp. SA15]